MICSSDSLTNLEFRIYNFFLQIFISASKKYSIKVKIDQKEPIKKRNFVKRKLWFFLKPYLMSKEGCNWGHDLSAAIKLGSLERTVIAFLLHSGAIFCGKNDVICYFGNDMLCRFLTKKKRPKHLIMPNWFFWSFATFFIPSIFWSGAKQRFCFREFMLVLDQNGRIQALGFLARWRLTSHALYYKIP